MDVYVNESKYPLIEDKMKSMVMGNHEDHVLKRYVVGDIYSALIKSHGWDKGLDIAELSVLNIINCVNTNVKRYHSPGLDVVFRMEDLTGLYIEGSEHASAIERYIKDFQTLLDILDYNGIRMIRESSLVNKSEFDSEANQGYHRILKYIQATDSFPESMYDSFKEFEVLKSISWEGIIPEKMRNYLYSKYSKLMGYTKTADCQKAAAKYLGATYGRHRMGITMSNPNMYEAKTEPIEIAFALPTPGIPEGMHSKRIYYRSITLKNTKKIVPYWRARGVLKVNSVGDVRYSLIGWSKEEQKDVIKGDYVLKNKGLSITVSAGTIIEE